MFNKPEIPHRWTDFEKTSDSQIIEHTKDASILVNNKVSLSKEVLGQLLKLKHIAICATGANCVDLAAAKSLDISLSNVPGDGSRSVSEHVFALILSLRRNLKRYQHDTCRSFIIVSAAYRQTTKPFIFQHKRTFERIFSRYLLGISKCNVAFKSIRRRYTTLSENYFMLSTLNNTRKSQSWCAQLLTMITVLFVTVYAQPPNNQLRGGEIQSKDEHQYGKVEVRMYSQRVAGTTSTFFGWRNGGHVCGTKWNEIDIETISVANRYQSNPIWQTSDADCNIKRSESLHGSQAIYDTWVTYTLEWTPDYIAWYRNGQQDRRITRNNHPSVQHIQEFMRYCFNLWSQGQANPDWLGNLDRFTIQKIN